MALAERMMAARFSASLVDHRTWVIAGDGCLQEGISHEAIDLAGHLRLGRLTVLWDDNSISIDGGTELSTSTNQLSRFRAAGWHVQSVDGHDAEAISDAITKAMANARPSIIACYTTIGYGAPTLAGTSKTMGRHLVMKKLPARVKLLAGLIPHLLSRMRFVRTGKKRQNEVLAPIRNGRIDIASHARQDVLMRLLTKPPQKLWRELKTLRQQFKTDQPKMATRQSSQKTLDVINSATSLTVGGSADLTGSNLTKPLIQILFLPDSSRDGTFIMVFVNMAWQQP